MKTLRIVGLSAALAHASLAGAGTLVSGPLSYVSGGSHRCWATNASDRPRHMTLEMLSSDGVVLATQPCSVGGWESCYLITSHLSRAYCRITSSGSMRSIVGSLEARDSISHPIAAIPIR